MIFDKNLVKLDIVWLSEKNIGLKPWDRGSNSVAHELARSSIEQVWLNDPPEFIIPLLLKDVTHVSNE
jgi:hypothetical protein